MLMLINYVFIEKNSLESDSNEIDILSLSVKAPEDSLENSSVYRKNATESNRMDIVTSKLTEEDSTTLHSKSSDRQ